MHYVNIIIWWPLTQRTAKSAMQSVVHPLMPGFPNNDEYGDLESHVVDAGK